MKAYLRIFFIRCRSLFQYRTAALAGMSTQFFFGMVKIMIFTGFYNSTKTVQPLSYSQTVSYMWLMQAFLSIIPFRHDNELVNIIKNGNVAYELVRPLNLFNLWFSKAIALRSIPPLLKCIPLILITAVIFPLIGLDSITLAPPPSIMNFIFFLISLTLGILISSLFTVLIGLSLFWTISGDGVNNLLPALIWTFTGITIPIPFFPDIVKIILRFFPVINIVDIPVRIYLGSINGHFIFAELLLQLFWIFVLFISGNLILKKALNRVIIQGG